MAAPESTKFQINYKLNDGTLINLYAATVTELEAGLADLAMNAMNIRTTGLELSGVILWPSYRCTQSYNVSRGIWLDLSIPGSNAPRMNGASRYLRIGFSLFY